MLIYNFIIKDFKNNSVHMYRHNEPNSAFNVPGYKSETDLSISVEMQ